MAWPHSVQIVLSSAMTLARLSFAWRACALGLPSAIFATQASKSCSRKRRHLLFSLMTGNGCLRRAGHAGSSSRRSCAVKRPTVRRLLRVLEVFPYQPLIASLLTLSSLTGSKVGAELLEEILKATLHLG